MSLFKKIIDRERESGVSLRQLSALMSVDVSELSRMYHGERGLTYRVARRLCHVSDMSREEKVQVYREIRHFSGLDEHECAAFGELLALRETVAE